MNSTKSSTSIMFATFATDILLPYVIYESQHLISSGFKQCGIYPFNPVQVTSKLLNKETTYNSESDLSSLIAESFFDKIKKHRYRKAKAKPKPKALEPLKKQTKQINVKPESFEDFGITNILSTSPDTFEDQSDISDIMFSDREKTQHKISHNKNLDGYSDL